MGQNRIKIGVSTVAGLLVGFANLAGAVVGSLPPQYALPVGGAITIAVIVSRLIQARNPNVVTTKLRFDSVPERYLPHEIGITEDSLSSGISSLQEPPAGENIVNEDNWVDVALAKVNQPSG